MPTVVVDDYGSITPLKLRHAWQTGVGESASPEAVYAGVAPAFVEYWPEALQRAAVAGG